MSLKRSSTWKLGWKAATSPSWLISVEVNWWQGMDDDLLFFKCFSLSLTHSCRSMQIHVPSTGCDIMSFNSQGQFCLLTCAGWRDTSNHTRMSTIQSRTPQKKATNHVTLTWKFPWKSCSTPHLPFLSSNPKILKAFLKAFPTEMKRTKCPAKEKNEEGKAKKEGRRETEK